MHLEASAPVFSARSQRSPAVGPVLRALVAGVMALAVVAGALVAVPAAPAQAQVSSKATNPAQGFDTCVKPTTAAMSNWWTSSPYTSVGIYIGGALRGCPQDDPTPSWVSTVLSQGWRLIPIWVGPQAPCGGFSQSISSDSATATAQGVSQAAAAAAAAQSLGLAGAPIYYDMEGYARGGSCSTGVQAFMSGWTGELHNRGFLAGLYSSLCSGIDDVAAVYQAPNYNTLDAIWVAAWNNTPNLFGYTSCGFSDSAWSNHQRLHQFKGGHNETWGGVTIEIDTNAVDGPTAPRASSPPGAPTLTAQSGNGVVHLQWTPAANASGVPLTSFRISRGTSPGSETTLATVSGDASNFDDRTVTGGTTYYYKVNASNAAGEGGASNEASAAPGTTTTLDVFARDGTSSLVWQHFDGTTWGSWQSIGSGIAGTPASTTDATGVWVFARGADSALYFRRMSSGSWGPWTSLGTSISGDPTAATDGTGVSVFARAPDNAVWTRRYTFAGGTWSAWTTLGPALVGTPAAAAGGTGLWVFARSADNGLWAQHYSDKDSSGRAVSTWSGWSPLGGVSASDPTAVVDAAGAWVFVRSPDNALWYRRFLAYFGGWTPWTSLGKSIVGTPSAAVDAGGVWVFARGPDNGAWYRRFSNSTQTWTSWTTVGPSITSNPVVRADGSGPRVFARGVDNALWYRGGWAFGWLPWSTAGGSFASDPVVSNGP